jgi:nucleotide-binding universal stress UspA family protein
MMTSDPNMTQTEVGPRLQRQATRRFEYLHALLALDDGQLHPDVLAQAHTVAGELRAQLNALRVLPPALPFLSAFMPEGHAIHSPRSVERCRAAEAELSGWCEDALSASGCVQCLPACIGSFVNETVRCAAQLQRSVVLLPPSTEQLGGTATAMARATLRPVMVVRPSRERGAVLVATDLEEDDSVLEQALDFGARFGGQVVALHNVSCLSGAVFVPVAGPATLGNAPVAGVVPTAPMERVAERLEPSSSIVTHGPSPVDAIIEQAHEQRARAIIVGTRRRSWFERFIEPSVAAAVAERAQCSVLILPCTQLRRSDARHEFGGTERAMLTRPTLAAWSLRADSAERRA